MAYSREGMDGVVRSWNRAAEKLYGYAPEEAIGRTVFELLVFPEDLPMIERKAVGRLKRNGAHEVTVRHRKKNGEEASRAELIGGQLEIGGADDGGTQVTCVAPIADRTPIDP